MKNNIVSLAENLAKEAEGIVVLAEKTENAIKLLEAFDQKLRKQENDLADKKIGLQEHETALKAKEDALSAKVQKVLESEQIHEKLIAIRDEIDQKTLKLHGDEAVVDAKMADLEKKLIELGDLQEKMKDLERRESLLAKETLLDRNRKESLDLREKRITRESERLQKISDSFK